MKGYVYVLSNESMPGVVKIGRSSACASGRAKQIHTTGVPTPFVVEFEILCVDAEKAEERAHRFANKSRVAAKREFFRLSVRDAVGVVVDAALVDWEGYEPVAPSHRRTWEPEPSVPCSPERVKAYIANLRAMLAKDDSQ
jgi:hypothetical protein